MTTKLLRLWLVGIVLTAVPFVGISTASLRVNQLSGFGANDLTNPWLRAWIKNVRANAALLDSTSVALARNMTAHMSQRSYWPKLIYLYPLLGNSIGAAVQPLKYKIGGNITPIHIAGTYAFSTGIQFNGTTEYIDSGVTPYDLGTSNNGGLGWWENNYTGTGYPTPIGCYNSPTSQMMMEIGLEPTAAYGVWSNVTTVTYVAIPSAAGNGHFYVQRSGATSRELFKNGSSIGTNTANDSATWSGALLTIFFGGRNGIAGGGFWPGRGACWYLTDGTLSAQEVTDLHNDLQTYLITPTGR